MAQLGRWREHLEVLLRRQGAAFQKDSEEVLREKMDHYFLPMLQWIDRLVERRQQSEPGCVCIGLSCVQGGGKTTATRLFQEMMRFTGRKCAVVSLDDAYVTHAEQCAIAKAHPENPLLQLRGNPGTQDIPFLLRFLDECKASKPGQEIPVPRYDKALHNGRGDRVDAAEWDKIQGPVDVVLVEGWCLGFRPLASTSDLDPNLIPVNDALRDYEPLYRALDGLIVIHVESPEIVYTWREEQEAQLRLTGKPVLSESQVRDFVDRYMPAYHAYLPDLYADPRVASPRFLPSAITSMPRLVIPIDDHRRTVQEHPTEYCPSPQ